MTSMNIGQPFEQQDSSMRSSDDDSLRSSLAASLARESALGTELQTAKVEIQRFVTEMNAHCALTANKARACGIMREEYFSVTE